MPPGIIFQAGPGRTGGPRAPRVGPGAQTPRSLVSGSELDRQVRYAAPYGLRAGGAPPPPAGNSAEPGPRPRRAFLLSASGTSLPTPFYKLQTGLSRFRFASWICSPSLGAVAVGSGNAAIDTSHLGFRPIQKIATIHASSGLAGFYGTGTNNREVSRESSRDQFGCWRCALRRHVGTGIRDAHEQSRRCSERPRAEPKRALRVQSVPVPMATELLPRLSLRLWVVLRL